MGIFLHLQNCTSDGLSVRYWNDDMITHTTKLIKATQKYIRGYFSPNHDNVVGNISSKESANDDYSNNDSSDNHSVDDNIAKDMGIVLCSLDLLFPNKEAPFVQIPSLNINGYWRTIVANYKRCGLYGIYRWMFFQEYFEVKDSEYLLETINLIMPFLSTKKARIVEDTKTIIKMCNVSIKTKDPLHFW